MPSSPSYQRNYAQETKTAKARGETGVGSNSGDAVRHRARRKAIKAGLIKAGSKLDKARELGVPVIDEAQMQALLADAK